MFVSHFLLLFPWPHLRGVPCLEIPQEFKELVNRRREYADNHRSQERSGNHAGKLMMIVRTQIFAMHQYVVDCLHAAKGRDVSGGGICYLNCELVKPSPYCHNPVFCPSVCCTHSVWLRSQWLVVMSKQVRMYTKKTFNRSCFCNTVMQRRKNYQQDGEHHHGVLYYASTSRVVLRDGFYRGRPAGDAAKTNKTNYSMPYIHLRRMLNIVASTVIM